MTYRIDDLHTKKEDQTYERKSARIEPKTLSNHITAFANADGGTIVIGIEDDGSFTGIDTCTEKINEILRVPYDFCMPSVRVKFEKVDCTDVNGNSNHLLYISIPPSNGLHANQQDDVYYRIGDKSKKLNFEDRLRLLYSKGERYYEDAPVTDSSPEDIDLSFVSQYCEKIGYGKSAQEYIRQNHAFLVPVNGQERLSGAAILLFGKDPQRFFPRARVRFIRYDGTEARTGTKMNIIKDKMFTGRILEMTEKTLAFVQSQIKEHTYLGSECKFVTVPEYPEFAWKEAIINAIAHRDYSIKGTDIQIKMFDDRITVESPGDLPGLVRLNNMRQIHFSRNPKITAFLHEYDYVQEFGEGVDRMFREMENAGLPAPEYCGASFMLHATIRNGTSKKQREDTDGVSEDVVENVAENVAEKIAVNSGLSAAELRLLTIIRKKPEITAADLASMLHCTSRTIQRKIFSLKEKGVIVREGSDRQGKWIIKNLRE